jgi:hypothetical protein
MSLTSESHASASRGNSPGRSNGLIGGRWSRLDDAVIGRSRPPKLYRIGEIIEHYGISRQTIHNYTTMGLLQETDRTRGGHRLYDESVFDRLDVIVRLKEENRSLGFIREYFAHAENEGHEQTPISNC